MDLTPSERARIVVRYLAKKFGETQFEIGQRLGYTNKSSFSSVINGHRDIPYNFAERLASLDPEINPLFLTGESDEILRHGNAQPIIEEGLAQQQDPQRGVFLPLELVKMFTAMSETIQSQQETIRILVGKGDADAKII